MSSMDKDYTDFTEKLGILREKKPLKILAQLSGYNEENTTKLIKTLSSELEQQKTIKSLLSVSDEDMKTNISFVKRFVKEKGPKITYQLGEIKRLCSELKETVRRNEEMEKKQEELLTLQNGKECRRIAQQMDEIRTAKEEIYRFLQEAGIVSPPLH